MALFLVRASICFSRQYGWRRVLTYTRQVRNLDKTFELRASDSYSRKNIIEQVNPDNGKSNTKNLEFIREPTAIHVPSSIADCIISNCALNLVAATEKHLAFNEMHRPLNPGGRFPIRGILIREELTEVGYKKEYILVRQAHI